MSSFKLSRDIGIDLGTSSVLLYLEGRGIVVNEPCAVALDKNSGKVLEVGADAKKMLGRTPGNIVAARPLEKGAISDYDMTVTMLETYLRRISRRSLVKPRVIISVPSGITEVEERAVIQASMEAGARRVYLIEEPLAAALGAGMNIRGAGGHMVIDIGGGTTDIAVLSMNNVVLSQSIDAAGDAFDDAIIQYIREQYSVLIGSQTAEELKMAIGCVEPRPETLAMSVKGRSLSTGLPQNVDITSVDIMHALITPCRDILYAVRSLLEKTNPELVVDISRNGIMLTGGGALLYGMDRLITSSTGIPCHVADDALLCVALGCGKSLKWLDQMNEGTVNYARKKLMAEN